MRPDRFAFPGLARFWGRLGITYKFGLAFTVLLVMVVLAATVNLYALMVVHEAETDILTSMEIRQKISEMDAGLEKARRLYRDFLLYYPEVGFARAQELYGHQALVSTARVISVNEELKGLLGGAHPSQALRRRNVDVTLYLSLAKRFADVLLDNMTLLSVLGDPENGLETQLTGRMEAMRVAVADSKSLSYLLQEADLSEKQYRITRQRPFMQSAFNTLGRLARAAGSGGLDASRKKALDDSLDEYTKIADKILDVDVAIRGNINDFTLQARMADPIAQELKVLSAAEVARYQARINWVSRAALMTVLGTTILGMFCAFVIAFVINSSITKKIVAMTRSADQLRSGNLDITVDADSGDELGVLADTFNSMTHRVKDLVENLEEKVRQRTQELAHINRQLDEKNKDLEILSQTDPLTGLCNRHRLTEVLLSELRRVKRYQKTFSVIMVDVDHFKSINDTFGHHAGDQVLRWIGDALTANARETDTVGRWGGEEFLVVCPETGLDVAERLAERLRRGIEKTAFPTSTTITASFGVASSATYEELESLTQRVDSALYRAKQGGRNRVMSD
ncbi:GGDEF domain-containing protein [Fundidesulfovibrio terrae]|uniref:GGDEF domain-containing protein n=1 Tax=Fundidesulfovibrio terrae TaxID=2922866 RepID=UPI001FB004DE|nr:GGDEF domain-containing protein [Fundidesulfovibrio terrae]